jgi:hypothetical protein
LHRSEDHHVAARQIFESSAYFPGFAQALQAGRNAKQTARVISRPPRSTVTPIQSLSVWAARV